MKILISLIIIECISLLTPWSLPVEGVFAILFLAAITAAQMDKEEAVSELQEKK